MEGRQNPYISMSKKEEAFQNYIVKHIEGGLNPYKIDAKHEEAIGNTCKKHGGRMKSS